MAKIAQLLGWREVINTKSEARMPRGRVWSWLEIAILLVACLGWGYTGRGSAQSLEAVLSPGKLIQAHAKNEEDCKSCHAPFKRAEQDGLCMSCHSHKNIAQDLRQKTGFHGKITPQACHSCHTDHKGRNARVVNLDEKGFNHNQTNFALKDAHTSITCVSCHKAGMKYRSAPHECVACHKKDDKHKTRFGDKCESCHTSKKWTELLFDHDKDTHFILRDKHHSVPCEKCHTGNLYREKLATTCVSCHKKDDKHQGSLGTACANCHVERGWKEVKFDHSKTRFPLLGKHDAVECKACHKTLNFKDTPMTCISCHKKDDSHKGSLGEACADCHQERSWKETTFDHSKTKFALSGAHATVKCNDCHPKNSAGEQSFRNTPLDCYSCHQKKDVHKGQQGKKCEECHTDRDWKTTKFDHGRAKFPLTGKHLKVECKACHKTQQFKDVRSDCMSCHAKDDKHKRTLGTQCEKCHNTRDWKLWDFNHDKRTQFKLDGKHKNVSCGACHKVPAKEDGKLATLLTTCVSCHAADDAHDGAFGTRCEKCHVTTNWKTITNRIGGIPAPSASVALTNSRWQSSQLLGESSRLLSSTSQIDTRRSP